MLNAILSGSTPIVDVVIENPYNPQDFQDDKLSVLDVKVTDEKGFIYDIEIQLSLKPGLIPRLVFYGSEIYCDQLRTGDDYTELKPVVVIALLNGVLWVETSQLHHRFLLTDVDSGRTLSDTLSIHTLELGKYNLQESDLPTVSRLDRWLYWLLYADRYDADELRRLFPDEDIWQASTALIQIAQQTEDKQMYDSREKAIRDQQWALNVARREGILEGEAIGESKGEARGKAEGKAEGEIKIIRILQEILLLPQSSESELSKKSLVELQQMTADLQAKIQTRKLGE